MPDDRPEEKRRGPSNATLIAIATLVTAIATAIATLVAAFNGGGPS